MPPKKGKKGKKQDDDWGDDKGIEQKMKNLMVADSDEEVKPAKKGKSLTPIDANDSSGDEEPQATAAKTKKSSGRCSFVNCWSSLQPKGGKLKCSIQ